LSTNFNTTASALFYHSENLPQGYFDNLNKNPLTKDKTIPNNIAAKKFSTPKFGTIIATNSIINALIISVNKPNVITLTGKVNNTSNGLIKKFTIDKTTDTTIATPKPGTEIPGII
jgi:hypothetical protein